MRAKVPYTFRKTQTFAVRKEGETEVQAVVRSLMSKPGVGRVAVSHNGESFGVEPAYTHYRLTVCEPKVNNGWPVECEFSLHAEH